MVELHRSHGKIGDREIDWMAGLFQVCFDITGTTVDRDGTLKIWMRKEL